MRRGTGLHWLWAVRGAWACSKPEHLGPGRPRTGEATLRSGVGRVPCASEGNTENQSRVVPNSMLMIMAEMDVDVWKPAAV